MNEFSRPVADAGSELCACLDRIDGMTKGPAQCVGKVEVLSERRPVVIEPEFVQEIGVAGLWIEVCPT